MRHDHRMAGRVAHPGLEADFAEFGDQPFGGPPALGSEGRIRRDRAQPQQFEQPLEAPVEIGVEMIEDRAERGHSGKAFRFVHGTLIERFPAD